MNTPEFKRWFGKSKVVDANGKPLVVYHGTQHGGFTAFDPKKRDAHHVGFFFTDDPELSATYSRSKLRDPFALQSVAVPDFHTVADLQDFLQKHGSVQDKYGATLKARLVRAEHHRVGEAWFLWESTFAPGEKSTEVEEIGPFLTEAHLLNFAKQHFRDWPQHGIYQVFLSMQHPFVMDAHGGRWDELKAADIVEGVRGLPIWQREDPAVRKMLLDLERKREVSTEWVTKFAKDAGCDGCIIRNCIDTNDEKKQIVADIYVVFEPTQIKSATNNRGTFDPHDPDIRNPRGTMKNPTYGTHPTALAKAHTAEGLLARMLADGADTFAKKVKWVAKHIPTVDDPQSFVGWVTASERKRKQTRIRKTRNPGEVEVSVSGGSTRNPTADVEWVEGNVLDREMRQQIAAFLQMIVAEGQAVSAALDKRYNAARKGVQGGDKVTLQHLRQAVRNVVKQTWGEDAMTDVLVKLIAEGSFVW